MNNEKELIEKVKELEKLVRKHELILRLIAQGMCLGGFIDPVDEEIEND